MTISTMISSIAEYRLVVLGGGAVGKSSLTIRLVTDRFLVDYDPTVEDCYRKRAIVDDQLALLDILDTAGQEDFASMHDQWIREGDGFLLVYSVTSKISFEEIEILYQKIRRTKGEEVPIVIVGNKCDLDDQRTISTTEGHALGRRLVCAFYETSAKLNVNIDVCYFQLVRQMRKLRGSRAVVTTAERKKRHFGCSIL